MVKENIKKKKTTVKKLRVVFHDEDFKTFFVSLHKIFAILINLNKTEIT